MVFVEWHLVNVSKYAPIDEVGYEAGKPGNSIALNLLKRHVDVLGGDLLRGVVERLSEVALSSLLSLALRNA